MSKQENNRIAALVLAVLTGLAIGLLLPGAARWTGLKPTVPQGGGEATAVFAQQAFSIAPLAEPESPQVAATVPAEPTVTAEAVSSPGRVQGEQRPTPEPDASAFSISLLAPRPTASLGSILIYHTHTYEAYRQTEPAYEETEKWRTADAGCNMIRVGGELTALLTGLGYRVVHDTTAFEPPDLGSAYTRSLAMLEKRIANGESYDLYIDLHRDAYVEGQAGSNTVSAGGTEVAKLMLLIGKGEGYTNAGYDRRPDWETNLQVAQSITEGLNRQVEGLCKEVRLKSGRFNQHVDTGCVLVEAGNNRNSMAEVLAAMPYLADAIHQALNP